MKSLYPKLSFIFYFLTLIFLGTFVFSKVTRVLAQISPSGFYFFGVDFGKVFPEEVLTRNVLGSSFVKKESSLDFDCPSARTDLNYSGHIKINLEKGSLTGYGVTNDDGGGLCPSLKLEKEGDGTGEIPDYLVTLDTPCIEGYVPQGENCVTVPAPGEYSCEYRIDESVPCGSLKLDLDENIFHAISSNPIWQRYDQLNGEIFWDICSLNPGDTRSFDVLFDIVGEGQWSEQVATFNSLGENVVISGCGGESYGGVPGVLGAMTKAGEEIGDILGLAATGGGWENLLLSGAFLMIGVVIKAREKQISKI